MSNAEPLTFAIGDLPIERDSAFRTIYSSNVNLRISLNDLTLKFANVEDQPGGALILKEYVAIVLHHDHLRRLHSALGDAISKIDEIAMNQTSVG